MNTSKMIQVVALDPGYDGFRKRAPGDVFEMPAESLRYSHSWYEEAKADGKPSRPPLVASDPV